MTPATDTQVWQYAVVAMAVAASAIAFACHLSPALRAWLRKKVTGGRLPAASADAACDQGCGPCGGCGARPSPRGSESSVALPRSRRSAQQP